MNQHHPQHEDENEIIDMELTCKVCGRKLYLPLRQAREVQATVNAGNGALLVCICGIGNLIFRKQKPQD